MCLFAFCAFLFRSAIRSASTWQILRGPSTLTKGRFTISSRTQGLGLVPCLAKFHDVPGVFLVKPRDFSAVSAIFGCSIDFRNTSQDELIKHFEKVQASQMTAQGPISCVRAFYILLLDSDSLVRFCDAQVVVDYLKQYDKDGKGALSSEELREAMRGAV